MSNRVSRTIELRFNELHQPIVEGPTNGKVRLEVNDPSAQDEMKYVKISGCSEALRALGVLLIGVSESPGHHLHIDEEVNPDWFGCQQGFSLTIENSAKVREKDERTTDRLPPDWARG